jgi:hypothetical protein
MKPLRPKKNMCVSLFGKPESCFGFLLSTTSCSSLFPPRLAKARFIPKERDRQRSGAFGGKKKKKKKSKENKGEKASFLPRPFLIQGCNATECKHWVSSFVNKLFFASTPVHGQRVMGGIWVQRAFLEHGNANNPEVALLSIWRKLVFFYKWKWEIFLADLKVIWQLSFLPSHVACPWADQDSFDVTVAKFPIVSFFVRHSQEWPRVIDASAITEKMRQDKGHSGKIIFATPRISSLWRARNRTPEWPPLRWRHWCSYNAIEKLHQVESPSRFYWLNIARRPAWTGLVSHPGQYYILDIWLKLSLYLHLSLIHSKNHSGPAGAVLAN